MTLGEEKMPILISIPVALVSCVAGAGVLFILRWRWPQKKKAIRLVTITTSLHFTLSLVALLFLPWEDVPGYDEYRGFFVLLSSFVAFTVFHAACLISYIVKKEPNQAAQTTPGLRPSVSDL